MNQLTLDLLNMYITTVSIPKIIGFFSVMSVMKSLHQMDAPSAFDITNEFTELITPITYFSCMFIIFFI